MKLWPPFQTSNIPNLPPGFSTEFLPPSSTANFIIITALGPCTTHLNPAKRNYFRPLRKAFTSDKSNLFVFNMSHLNQTGN